MRFDCGPTYEERERAQERWHSWFAWHPVRVGPRECRWLERIERRCVERRWDGEPTWEYRA